jgi:K+-sensing histidine kinase KdpD
VAQRAARYVADFFKGQALVMLPGGKATSSISLDGSAPPQKLQLALTATSSDSFVLDKQEEAVAHLAFEDNALVGLGSPSLPDHPVLHAPLSSSGRCIGVLAFLPKDRKLFADLEQRNLLVAFCDQVAIALERAQLPYLREHPTTGP